MKNEFTSKGIGKLASIGLTRPWDLTDKQIQKVCASVLTQRPDKTAKKRSKSEDL
jgi:hypothetical protein